MVTTIPEAVTTIPAGTLRLLLTSISYRAKARKEMRRKPPMVPRRPPHSCYWTAPPGGVCKADPLHPYIPYYNRRLPCSVQRSAWRWYLVSEEVQRLTVCPPMWRRWWYRRLVRLLCCVRWNWSNQRKRPCKAL